MNNAKVGRGHINTMILATWGQTFLFTDNRILRIDTVIIILVIINLSSFNRSNKSLATGKFNYSHGFGNFISSASLWGGRGANLEGIDTEGVQCLGVGDKYRKS